MKYDELVTKLRTARTVSIAWEGLMSDAAAIEALETEIRESMQKCAECGDANMPKRGEWIGVSPMVDTVQCSVCGGQLLSAELKTPYCPYCGAKMEVQDEA